MRSIAPSSNAPANFLIHLIRFYQLHISPYKGYSCPHRLLHGGRSCSAYAKHILQRFGLRPLFPLLLRRRNDCRAAAMVLSSQRPTLDHQGKPSPEPPKEYASDRYCAPHWWCDDISDERIKFWLFCGLPLRLLCEGWLCWW